jgi:MbtH protein
VGQEVATGSVTTGSGKPAGVSDRLQVVVNDEEQYSTWPAHKVPPAGWRGVSYEGSREECLAYIEKIWTDMRPLSVRRQLGQAPRADDV